MARSGLSADRSLDLLPLPEALRTVGLGLEVASVPRAKLTVDPVGIVVATEAPYGQREYRWSELDRQSRARQSARGTTTSPSADPTTLTRWSVLLRVIGHLLDGRGVHYCVVEAAVAPADDPWDCDPRVAVGGKTVLDADLVRSYARWLRSCNVDPRQADLLPEPRPWWAIWRK